MLLDHRSVPSLAFASCFERDELTAEAAEIDAARDMEVYLGFAGDTALHNRRPLVADVRADIPGSSQERQARFKDQPVHSASSGGAEVRSAFEHDMDWEGDDAHGGSMRLKVLHTPCLTPEHVSYAGYSGGEH